MTSIDKKVEKFLRNPTSSKYKDVERILLYFGFENISIKGSHIKFKHPKKDFVIPVHNGECKDFYKKEIRKFLNSVI